MKTEIANFIKDFVKNYKELKGTRASWEEPLVAYVGASDERFLELKKTVSPTHALPQDLLEDAGTVITYFIPFEKSVVKSNIRGRECSEIWAISYIETNQLILDLNTALANWLKELGYKCAIIPATHNFDEAKLISDWSHRHIAFLAGLGNFGVNNMLITSKGCCGRVGSIVTSLELPETKHEIREYCLYKYNKSCSRCVERCVNGALARDSFDRKKCYEMCLYNDSQHQDIGLSDVCGKCLVGIPCSFIDPVEKLIEGDIK